MKKSQGSGMARWIGQVLGSRDSRQRGLPRGARVVVWIAEIVSLIAVFSGSLQTDTWAILALIVANVLFLYLFFKGYL